MIIRGLILILLLELLLSSSLHLTSLHSSSPAGAYIHIPFCRRRCFYCDFPIRVVGDRPSTIAEIARQYTALLECDIEQTARYITPSVRDVTPLETIYFGGGTPSLLPVDCELVLKNITCERVFL
jgi:coproporphyrinogen III oxidase-like Fe-S oxidoreductase